jgi:hypothetical protein
LLALSLKTIKYYNTQLGIFLSLEGRKYRNESNKKGRKEEKNDNRMIIWKQKRRKEVKV